MALTAADDGMRNWAALDLDAAWREAERACKGAYGPVLTCLTDGYEATAFRLDGRRFHQPVASGIAPTPVVALERLAELMEDKG